MSTYRVGRRFLRWLSAAVVLAASCQHSNDVTGVSSSPTIDVAGAWSGSFTEAGAPFLYGDPSLPALASLQQTGTSVDGTISISGSPTITIHATISGTHLTGSIEDTSGAGTANGTVTTVQLTITLAPHDLSRAGQVVLRR